MNNRVKKIDKLISSLDKKYNLNTAEKLEIKDILIDYKRQLIAVELQDDIIKNINDENSLSSVAEDIKKASKELRRKW